jgi:hypothetical protein
MFHRYEIVMTLSGVDHSDHWEHYTSSFLKLQNVSDTNSCTLIVRVSRGCGWRGREVLTPCTCSQCSFGPRNDRTRSGFRSYAAPLHGDSHDKHGGYGFWDADGAPLVLGCSCYTYFDRIRTRLAETVTGTSVSFSSCSPFKAYALHQDVQL